MEEVCVGWGGGGGYFRTVIMACAVSLLTVCRERAGSLRFWVGYPVRQATRSSAHPLLECSSALCW